MISVKEKATVIRIQNFCYLCNLRLVGTNKNTYKHYVENAICTYSYAI